MSIVYEAVLGSKDGASRAITLRAADQDAARAQAEALAGPDEDVIYVEQAELDELTEDGLPDHPDEPDALALAPAPSAQDLHEGDDA